MYHTILVMCTTQDIQNCSHIKCQELLRDKRQERNGRMATNVNSYLARQEKGRVMGDYR